MALPPEFLQRAQQGGIVVTGRPSFPFCPRGAPLALSDEPALIPRPSPALPPTRTSLLTQAFVDIPKLDLESYIQNYRGTWSYPATRVCIHTDPLSKAVPDLTDYSPSPERPPSLVSMR